jgi:hypothetical protein
MSFLQTLGMFAVGCAVIAAMIAIAWPTLVEYRGYPRGTLPGSFVANAYFSAPLFSMGGLAVIGWSFTFQPLLAAGLLLVTLAVGYVLVRKAFDRTEALRRERFEAARRDPAEAIRLGLTKLDR